MPIYTKIRLTMLCLSGFELHSRWVPLIEANVMAVFQTHLLFRLVAPFGERRVW